MNRRRGTSRAFLTLGIVFLILAILPAIRGGHLNSVYLPLAIVFIVVGGAVGRRARKEESRPPAP
jgi:hypothetical protein